MAWIPDVEECDKKQEDSEMKIASKKTSRSVQGGMRIGGDHYGYLTGLQTSGGVLTVQNRGYPQRGFRSIAAFGGLGLYNPSPSTLGWNVYPITLG